MTRLPARLLVDALLRASEANGGFAAVLALGDAHGGTVLIQCRDRGQEGPLLERQFDGQWLAVGPAPDAPIENRADYLARRHRIDPDMWLIELDIAQAQQFVANLNLAT